MDPPLLGAVFACTRTIPESTRVVLQDIKPGIQLTGNNTHFISPLLRTIDDNTNWI